MILENKLIIPQLKGLNPLVSILCVLLIIGSLLIVSCKRECVDICSDYWLTLDKENCSCICFSGQTTFEFNGYPYCIEESESHDIYVLDKFNATAWLLNHGEICYPPQIFLSRVPKALDSLESFVLEGNESAQYLILFNYYTQESFRFPCGTILRHNTFLPIKKLTNISSPVVLVLGVESYFSDGFLETIRYDLFKNKSSLGIIEFSESMEKMTLHVLGYNHFHDMGDAFYNLTLEEIFNFPYVPTQSVGDPYDPLHITLTFSRLNFE